MRHLGRVSYAERTEGHTLEIWRREEVCMIGDLSMERPGEVDLELFAGEGEVDDDADDADDAVQGSWAEARSRLLLRQAVISAGLAICGAVCTSGLPKVTFLCKRGHHGTSTRRY